MKGGSELFSSSWVPKGLGGNLGCAVGREGKPGREAEVIL